MENNLNLDIMPFINTEAINKQLLTTIDDTELFSKMVSQQLEQLDNNEEKTDNQELLSVCNEIDIEIVENEEEKIDLQNEQATILAPLVNQSILNPLIEIEVEKQDSETIEVGSTDSQDLEVISNQSSRSSNNELKLNEKEHSLLHSQLNTNKDFEYVNESLLDEVDNSVSNTESIIFEKSEANSLNFELNQSNQQELAIDLEKKDIEVDLPKINENQEIIHHDFEIYDKEIKDDIFSENNFNNSEKELSSISMNEMQNTEHLSFLHNSEPLNQPISYWNEESVDETSLEQPVSKSSLEEFKKDNTSRIITELNNETENMTNFDSRTFKLTLQPENLGKLEVKLEMKSGKLNAEFIVENNQVKELIENQFTTLRENFLQQNIQIETMDALIHSPENNTFNFGGDLNHRQQQQKQLNRTNKFSQQYANHEDDDKNIVKTSEDSVDIYV